jgi:predicted AlkP superfamily pyrophosphatase or phosphodiesterase
VTAAGRPVPLLVLDVVGLTPDLLRFMPRLAALARGGSRAELGGMLPAVTCSVQTTYLTGAPPAVHGIVGNGWYDRELGEVLMWRQHNGLVAGDRLWDGARRAHPGYSVANICWWYAMGAGTDLTVTPRPVYRADGRKDPGCYTRPPELHGELTGQLGEFPLFRYWGPGAGLASSRWIIGAARHVLRTRDHDLVLAYIPHLDYDLQRYGPHGPAAREAAAGLDAELAPLIDEALSLGRTVVALSEYGIAPVRRPVDVNRALRRAGLLRVHTQDGMEYLDPGASRAFAVADHQIAHVYVARDQDVPAVREALEGLEGVAALLDDEGKKAGGLDHPRAGTLVALAEPDAWFTYYYWLDDGRAPDFARLVEIHRKPGYDPAELFMDPLDPYVRVRAAWYVARKKLGLRYRMAVVPLDPGHVRGSHGRYADDPAHGPLMLCSAAGALPARAAATEVKSLLLNLAGLAARQDEAAPR